MVIFVQVCKVQSLFGVQKESHREGDDERMSSDGEEDEDKTLHCCCQMPTSDLPFIACDVCDTWFHFPCVGLEPRSAKARKYTCPICKAAKGETKELKNTMARIRKTR